MTWPEKESPAFAGQGLDRFSRAITKSKYADQTSNSTAVSPNNALECRFCAAFIPTETGRGECHRYAPKPDFEHTFAVEWPKLTASDFCIEFVARGGE